jgi:hypothetical protein
VSAAESTNATVIVTAPARLETCIWDGTVHLTIDDGIHKYELPWAVPDYYDGLAALESNRVYTFTVVDKPFPHG